MIAQSTPMMMAFRARVQDETGKTLLEAWSLTQPQQITMQALTATATRFGLGKPAKLRVDHIRVCPGCGCAHDQPCRDHRPLPCGFDCSRLVH